MSAYYSPAQKQISRVGVCLPCDMLSALNAMVGRDAGFCDCKKALTLLMRLGAIHSARMHAAGADANPERWTRGDWLMHFEEEERLFFPLLPRAVADPLYQEHQKFRQEILTNGFITSKSLLQTHATMEDNWAERMLNDLESRPKTAGSVGQSLPTITRNMAAGVIAALLGVGFIASAIFDKRAV